MSESNNTVLHIACAVDDSFAYPLSVMIVSLLENNKQNNVKIHLFSAALSESYVSNFNKIVADYNQSFQFYRLNKESFKGLPVSNRISFAAYYRILMPETIEPAANKFLYLDADIIVVGNLAPLFEIDMGTKIFGAINDVVAIDCNMHIKHSIPQKYLYFNSGVLLINRENWLNNNATEQVFNYLKLNIDICDFHDQDGLNGSLYNQRFNLSPIWNQQIGLYYINKDVLDKVYDNYTEALNKPVIVHFNGIEKPWHYVSAHPYRKLFDTYARLVKLFSYSEKLRFGKVVKRNFIYPLFGWPRVNKYYYYKTRVVKY